MEFYQQVKFWSISAKLGKDNSSNIARNPNSRTFLVSFRSFLFLSFTHWRKHCFFIQGPVIIYVEGGEGKICWKDPHFCKAPCRPCQ